MNAFEKITHILILLLILLFVVVGIAFSDTIVIAKKKADTGFAWSSYLAAHYKFETGALGTDETANNNDLSGTGASSSTTHYVDGSYSLLRDATDDSVYLADASLAAGFPGKASTGYQNFLVSGWLWQNTAPSANSARDILAKYCADGTQRSWKATIWYTSGQAPHFKVQMSADGSTGDVLKEFTSADGSGWPDTIETGRWYFFAMWHDSTLDKWGAYIYDASTETGSTYYSTAYTSGVNIGEGSTAPIGIGQYMCYAGDIGYRTDGWIDGVVIYAWPDNVNPTEEEIQTRIAALRDLTAP
jgi:hypothetical protein